jgi:hypothetical protein
MGRAQHGASASQRRNEQLTSRLPTPTYVSIATVEHPTNDYKQKQTPWPLVRERTIPTDRPPLVGEI